jgi:hypothetical protein
MLTRHKVRSERLPRSGRGGRRFKSCHSDQLTILFYTLSRKAPVAEFSTATKTATETISAAYLEVLCAFSMCRSVVHLPAREIARTKQTLRKRPHASWFLKRDTPECRSGSTARPKCAPLHSQVAGPARFPGREAYASPRQTAEITRDFGHP